MATATLALVTALRTTAARMASGAVYTWTHLGACTCGHLAQTLTPLSPAEIHRLALQRPGDWAEQALEFCPSSGLPLDHVFSTMLAVGLSTDDIANLERLADPRVQQTLDPALMRSLDYRNRDHVVAYLRAWAALLEDELPSPSAPAPSPASPPVLAAEAAPSPPSERIPCAA
jgi:hypothetical protein